MSWDPNNDIVIEKRHRTTDEKMRVKIAEACGWTAIREQDYCEAHVNPYDGPVLQFWQGVNPNSGELEPLPDYLNDLNAMLRVYLVNDCEYVAAVSAEQAAEFGRNSECTGGKHDNPIEVEVADHHGYSDDAHNSRTPDRTMIEQARQMWEEGRIPPFHVAVSYDLI